MVSTPVPSYPLTQSADLDIILEEIGDKRIVLLGEASHGTSDYYNWRSAISKRLVKEKGFNFIAVEGDWPDCYTVNRFIKGYKNGGTSAVEVLKIFNRWPSWMWANWEIVALMDALLDINSTRETKEKVGFYGLDVYSLWESLESIIKFLKNKDPEAVAAAQDAFQCFEPFNHDPQRYARATSSFIPHTCTDEVVSMLRELRSKPSIFEGDLEEKFNTEQNALVTVNAEKYYRAMVHGGAGSWNVRDKHMMQTLTRLLEHHGPESKAIIWEHNTHVGDARATDMAREGMVNVGQLVREQYGEDECFIIGFGSYKGSVIAGVAWEAPMEIMKVPEAKSGSWEDVLHQQSPENKLLLSRNLINITALQKPIGHRAIGVVYNPAYERYGNYVPSIIPMRYDAFLYIDETMALHPLNIKPQSDLPPELYPWNF
ncbi:MAG: erythromycin esterase family protein [Bacteroidia bacterium]